MLRVLNQWFHRYFSDPQAVLLLILLVTSVTVLMTMGEMLAPVLAAIVIAYLLEGLVGNMHCRYIPRLAAVIVVFSIFLTVVGFISFVLFPLLSYQFSQFLQELPNMIARGQELLMQLPQRYPEFISSEQLEGLINALRSGIRNMGTNMLVYSLASITTLMTLVVYLVLVPLLVFFFLKDKDVIINWLVDFLPKERAVATRVWKEMDAQIGNYVRGKVYEIFIIGVFSYIPFSLMGLNYASLLAVLVGLSVIIPYIGAVAVTFPVILIAYFQWGSTPEFVWLTVIYTVVQAFDGNVLVPLLFSEAVNLHPVAIIVAVLVFGGIGGFWGIFFAIPLATLVKALLSAWPRTPEHI
jgi:putative permease